jgi:glycosyltransferase involved in cell wall biosynthesis
MEEKILIFLNSSWNLVNFRAGLVRVLISKGYEVVAVTPKDEFTTSLSHLGCRHIHLPMDSKGISPAKDILMLYRIFKLLRSENPDVLLGYTIKPNIYGSIAASVLQIPTINNISGLGTTFIRGGLLKILVRMLYRFALRKSYKVFFQNNDDRKLFISNKLVSSPSTALLPGSGIDLKFFLPLSLPNKPRIRFLLVARMIWDKGVGEFVQAARILNQRGIDAEFCLLGFLDVQNPTAISRKQMDEWTAEGVVNYLGVSDSVCEEIALADCVVLPSYREGTPRTLLEAAAMARPIVTTDTAGCREVVDDGINGFLCRVRDGADLAIKMERIVNMSPKERETMGMRGREKVERQFDEKIVINKYLEVIEDIGL